MITLHTQIFPDNGDPLRMDCPACGAKNVSANPQEKIDRVKLAFLIPLMSLRNTLVVCSNCHEPITCMAPMANVAGKDAATVTPLLRYHSTTPAKILSAAGLLTALVPVLGLIVVTIASFLARGTKGWPVKVNLIALCLSVTVTFCVLFVWLGGR